MKNHALIIAVAGILFMVLALLVGYLILHTEHAYMPKARCRPTSSWWLSYGYLGGSSPVRWFRVFGHTFLVYKHPLV